MSYLESSGNSDFEMLDGLYRNGGYLFLNGSSTYNTYIPQYTQSGTSSSTNNSATDTFSDTQAGASSEENAVDINNLYNNNTRGYGRQ